MWYQILLLSSVALFFTGCKTKGLFLTEQEGLKLSISTPTNITSDTVKITVSFENNTNNDFYRLNRKNIVLRNKKDKYYSSAWYLEVRGKDSIQRELKKQCSADSRLYVLTKKDYSLLKTGDKYSFKFNLNLKRLGHEPDKRTLNARFATEDDIDAFINGYLNKDYGDYTIRLYYEDQSPKIKNGLSSKIKSNAINITYKE